MTSIAQQIDARMKAQNLTITSLESKSGLKPHAVRNILTGKSKSPSAVNLQAIADVLGCSVKELLSTPAVLEEKENSKSLEELLREEHNDASLMLDCVKVIEDSLQKAGTNITTAQFLTCVKEVYLHSLQIEPRQVNSEFAEWFVALMDS